MSIDIRDERARDSMDTPPPGYGEWDDIVDEVHDHLHADLDEALESVGMCFDDLEESAGTICICNVYLPTLEKLFRPSMHLSNGTECFELGPYPSLREELANQLESAARTLREAAGKEASCI